MRKERTNLELRTIKRNDGQLEWLPRNPRQWTQTDIDNTARSIAEDEDFLEDRPLLVTPDGDEYIVFAGNLRREGAKKQKMKTVPAVVYYPETDEDRLTIKRRAMKDNGSFGAFDYDILANEWDDMPLADFGVPVWDTSSDMKLTTEGREGGEGYDEFVDKFKQKLTTDDCYTPPEVFEVVRDFVDKQVAAIAGRKIVRPFFPGGNYEDLTQYPEGCIVLDNPPFSILAKIIRFYCDKGIRFFLFGPQLTLFSAHDCDITYIVANAPITYENGAVVSTGFITNLIPDLRIWCCPELRDAIIEAQEDEDKTKQGFVYPDNIVTAATLGKLVAHYTGLKIRKISCEYIKTSDSAEEQGRALYGGGFILSDKAAAERVAAERVSVERAAEQRAAAERAAAERAAAQRAAATRLNISARERAIIEKLNAQDGHIYQSGEKGPET